MNKRASLEVGNVQCQSKDLQKSVSLEAMRIRAKSHEKATFSKLEISQRFATLQGTFIQQ